MATMTGITPNPTPVDTTRLVASDAARPSALVQQVAPASAAPASAGAQLQGVTLADVTATLGVGRNLVADYVMGTGNQLAQIRVIDPATRQVVAESPPDSIQHMQQEMLTYQSLANQSRAAADQ